ncbi:nuclear transport factor 2 family protein [Nocardia xishanensis]
MTPSATSTPGPLEIYRRMQEAVLREATLLPTDLLAEDVLVEEPFAAPGGKRAEGREAWLQSYAAPGSAAHLVRFEQFRELSTYQTDDPEVIVVEYELEATVIATGVRSSVTCIATLRVRDGLIKHWREYQDIPAIAAALSQQPE